MRIVNTPQKCHAFCMFQSKSKHIEFLSKGLCKYKQIPIIPPKIGCGWVKAPLGLLQTNWKVMFLSSVFSVDIYNNRIWIEVWMGQSYPNLL